MPGWTIALLALSLLVPVGLAAGSGLVSAARSPIEAIRGSVWTLLRALPFLAALLVLLGAALVGLLPDPEFPFDPRSEGLGTGGTASVLISVLLYCVVAFFLRPLRPPPSRAVATAAPAALLVACLATFGLWLANPYLGFVVAVGLQAWVLAAARLVPGRPAATGFLLLGLVPGLVLLADLAGRFDAGIGVWHDVVLMVADGQIGASVALLACLLAGAGVAIVAVAGRAPGRPPPEMRLEGEISVRRRVAAAEPAEPEPGRATDEQPEDEPEAPPEPAQPEPERDPRLWSKPRGSSWPPPGSRSPTPSPSVT
jgi:hypothetical protein